MLSARRSINDCLFQGFETHSIDARSLLCRGRAGASQADSTTGRGKGRGSRGGAGTLSTFFSSQAAPTSAARGKAAGAGRRAPPVSGDDMIDEIEDSDMEQPAKRAKTGAAVEHRSSKRQGKKGSVRTFVRAVFYTGHKGCCCPMPKLFKFSFAIFQVPRPPPAGPAGARRPSGRWSSPTQRWKTLRLPRS